MPLWYILRSFHFGSSQQPVLIDVGMSSWNASAVGMQLVLRAICGAAEAGEHAIAGMECNWALFQTSF